MQHFGEADYEIEKAIAAHHGSLYIAKNCECWEGYKRVPGTKPCAPGSCEKCDSHSKKSAMNEVQKQAGIGQDIINMVMTTYSQYPNFVRSVVSALMQMSRAFSQGTKGQQLGALGPHIENCFNLWREGKLGLDDIDQMLIGNNVVGDVNVDLPARSEDFQKTIQTPQAEPAQQMSMAAKYKN